VRPELEQALRDAVLAALPAVDERPSRFERGRSPAFWRGRREIAHLHRDDELDARVPPAEQKAWRSDPRAVPRPSRSPWMAFRLGGPDDVPDAVRLVRRAYDAAGG